ncbi:GcrA family cell cycle regulator [Rhizobium sp. CFBP 8762]|uniref:GcrA family cell cycle regulator n=1 Tax=Rhizobium sp. CFBP 8762 TaxID=2775279 RepID=UPI00177F0D4D|nr:GcrA family cell cycle regulator [Rhizobium sp. CFBP 8762]MBD8553593.1 GcrA family cell cycle regulator [Rhizobium sp. CFBP 8762]
MNWTDERVEKLKKLWAEGLSASQIAAQLGGVSRNAVIGKVHRLCLPGRAKSGGGTPAAKRPATPRPQTFTARPATVAANANVPPRTTATADVQDDIIEQIVEEVAVPVVTGAVPAARCLELTELTDRTCKWPIGDPLKEEFHFCGNDAPEASPYCSYHARLAYQPSSERRRSR